MLVKGPGVSAIAIASPALGIGANTAIFTLDKAALLDALSVPHPEQLKLLAYAQDDRSVVRNDWGDFAGAGGVLGGAVVAELVKAGVKVRGVGRHRCANFE